jgi:hypothetical protein
VEARSAGRGPSSGRGGSEMRNWWSYKWISQKNNLYKDKHSWKPMKFDSKYTKQTNTYLR